MGDAARSASCTPSYPFAQSNSHPDAFTRKAGMTDWKLAMLAIIPLVIAWRLPKGLRQWGEWLLEPRARTWLAMMAASLAAVLIPVDGSWTDAAQNTKLMAWYIAIDGIAGAFILSSYRFAGACLGQFIIALIFAGMVTSHVGFIIASNPPAIGEYLAAQSGAGWVQFAILLAWGVGDVGGSIYRRMRPSDRVPAYHNGGP